jgi:hypothetical protein
VILKILILFASYVDQMIFKLKRKDEVVEMPLGATELVWWVP